ncbi:MAG: restriction endonuclease, partial [Bacteroidota bacterium]
MSTPSHHTEWLSLLDVSGPFLSLPVLKEAYPQGLPAVEEGLRRDLRLAVEEWEDEVDDVAIHRAWIDFVLHRVLGWPDGQIIDAGDIPGNLRAKEAEQGETLRPDLVLINPAMWESNAGMPRVLISLYPASQQLERPIAGKVWKASPATRMMELLHGAGIVLGLVTNGAQWMLVHAPVGESAGYISWYTNLLLEEPPTFHAFAALLGAPLLFGETDERTLEALLKKSAERQQEVTEQLGLQVRASVEILVQAFDRLDAGRGGALLKDIAESRLYESAVTVMMRLVFLLSAEERSLLLHNASELYDSHYAASTLAAQLRETADRHGEELLERRHDAWARLLALFRAVYGGLRHEDLHLPAYGGALFDPDRFPFLEGRLSGTSWQDVEADPLAVDNRTVLHVLESLQFLTERDARGTSEPRRLSFRALDIEQIGHVYESLLDHTVLRAPADRPVLGLIGKRGYEPEVDLAVLEQLAGDWTSGSGAMPTKLEAFLIEQSGKSVGSLRKAVESELHAQRAARLRAACGQNEELYVRILPWAGLIRDDSYGRPVLIPPGAAYVTQGSE